MSSLNKGLIFHAPLSEKYEKVGSELVTNGDFSDYTGTIDDSNEDTFSDWNLIENSGNAEYYAVSDAPNGYAVSDAPNGYSTAIKYVQATAPGAGDDHLFYQSISYTTGKKYKLTFWAKSSASKTIYIHDSYAPPHILNKSVTLTTEWQKFDFYWTADDNSDRIKFILGYGASDVYITGISIKEVQTADITPNGNHGVVYGASYTTGRTGQDGEAINIPYSPNHTISCGDVLDIGTSDRTISLWFRKDGVENTWAHALCTKRSDDVDHELTWNLQIRGSLDSSYEGKLLARLGNGTGNGVTAIYSTNRVDDNQWHHAVLVIDRDDKMYLYVDGELNSSADISAYANENLNTSRTLAIGNESHGNYPFGGDICDVRMWNRPLSEIEVKQLYYSYKPSGGINTGKLNKGLILDMPLKSKNEKVGEELITNGNFENWNSSTDLANWNETNVSTGVRDILQESSVVYSGTYSVKFQATNNDGSSAFFIKQPVSSTGGKKYKITLHSYYASRSSGQAKVYVYNSDSTELLKEYTISTQENGWTKHNIYVTAIDSTMYIIFGLYNETTGYVYLDSISVKELKTADNTPNSNHGTVYGANVSEDYTSFDGTNDYIEIPHSESLNITDEITISAWVKVNNWTGDNQFMISKGFSSAYSLILFDNSNFKFEIKTDTGYQTLDSLVQPVFGQWYHLVGTYDKTLVSDNLKVYVNGVFKNSMDNTEGIITNDNPVYIGRHALGLYFHGTIAKVRIWNRALSAEEIKLLYEKGR